MMNALPAHCTSQKNGRAIPAKLLPKYLAFIPGWTLAANKKRIHRKWIVKDFLTALDFFRRIGRVAEAEDHHPDLHLRGYRKVTIELSTHDVDGLTENDFILAAKIDRMPIQLKLPKK